MKVELWCDSQPIPTDSPAQAIPGHARSQELQPKEDDVQIWGEEMFRAGSPFQLPVMLSPVLVPPSPTSTIRSATALTGLASHGVDSPVSDGGLSLVSGPPTSASSGRARQTAVEPDAAIHGRLEQLGTGLNTEQRGVQLCLVVLAGCCCFRA